MHDHESLFPMMLLGFLCVVGFAGWAIATGYMYWPPFLCGIAGGVVIELLRKRR